MKKTYRIAPEVKERILKRIKDDGVPVAEAAKEHGLNPATIYNRLGKGVKNAPTIGEVVRLKRQNEELLTLVGSLTLGMSRSQKKS